MSQYILHNELARETKWNLCIPLWYHHQPTSTLRWSRYLLVAAWYTYCAL